MSNGLEEIEIGASIKTQTNRGRAMRKRQTLMNKSKPKWKLQLQALRMNAARKKK